MAASKDWDNDVAGGDDLCRSLKPAASGSPRRNHPFALSKATSKVAASKGWDNDVAGGDDLFALEPGT
ncbi:MAG: hypothetical protein RL199_120 [Pseudomonadota bacterium]